MKNFILLLFVGLMLTAVGCSKETPIESEPANLEVAVPQSKAASNTINITPGCGLFNISTNGGCGSGLVLKYSIYDLAGNLVDSDRLVMTGNSHNTDSVLDICTSYRVVVQLLSCNNTDQILTTLGCSGDC